MQGHAQPRCRMLRPVLKTQVPSGFCFGSRAAPRASAPSLPILFSEAENRPQRSSGNQGFKVMQPFHRCGPCMGMMRGSGPALQSNRVLRAVLKTHVPSGFCFGSRAAPRATAPPAPKSLAAAGGRAQILSGNHCAKKFHRYAYPGRREKPWPHI